MTVKQAIQHDFDFGIPGDAPAWAVQLTDSLAYALRTVALRADMAILEGADASKPTADGSKRFYYATDTDTWYYDKGSWVKIDHTTLGSIGSNTHAQIDTHITAAEAHIASTSNPHSVDKDDVGLGNVTNDAQLKRADADFNSFSEKSSPVDADIVLIEDSAASYAKKKVQLSNLIPTPSADPLVILRHIEDSGDAGGGQSSGSWATRTLNQELEDSDNICTLSSNQFSLPAGTYEIEVVAQFYGCGQCQIRLYNVSDTSVECYGTSALALSGGTVTGEHSTLYYRFTLASTKTLRIESRTAASNTTNGWGYPTSFGGGEVYLIAKIKKVA